MRNYKPFRSEEDGIQIEALGNLPHSVTIIHKLQSVS